MYHYDERISGTEWNGFRSWLKASGLNDNTADYSSEELTSLKDKFDAYLESIKGKRTITNADNPFNVYRGPLRRWEERFPQDRFTLIPTITNMVMINGTLFVFNFCFAKNFKTKMVPNGGYINVFEFYGDDLGNNLHKSTVSLCHKEDILSTKKEPLPFRQYIEKIRVWCVNLETVNELKANSLLILK